MSSQFRPDDDDKRPLDLKVWRRVVVHARPYRKQLFGLAGCGMAIAGVDVLIPLVTGWLIDEAIAGDVGQRLYGYGIGYALLFGLLAACIWLFILLAGQTSTGVAYDLRRKAFGRLQELSFSYFDKSPVGWLVAQLTADCSKLSSLMPWFMLDLAWGSATVLGIAAAMLWLDAGLALWVLAIVPPLLLVSHYFQQRLLASSRLVRKTYALLAASFNEGLMGVRTTKALVREGENLGEFQELSTDMFTYSMRTALQSAVYLPLVMCLGSVGVGLALWRGGLGVEEQLGLSLGTLVAFMQYAALFSMPIRELAERFTQLQAAQAAAERVQGLLETVPEIKDAEVLRPDPERIERLELRGVRFAYTEDEEVLCGVDLSVNAGETVALVGATGGGKSTIVSLVARFYEPTAGQILVDGVDYRELSLRWLQSNLGVVLQVPHLFSGTVAEAIRYGRLNASQEEIEAAAKRVNAHGFISELPGGYEFEVGEGGQRLSTGQRQLISLARAVLADPQIFIMDEATSSVDTETEGLIQDGIEEVLAGRIAFVIAHRLSTIRNADQILVIDGGQIVEQGRHAELLGQRGRYYALYTRQFQEEGAQRMAEEVKAP